VYNWNGEITIVRRTLSILATTLTSTFAAAATIDVPGDFPTIQQAIDASSDGDVVEIAAGTYHESDIVIQQKDIILRGATHADGLPATTIDSQGGGKYLMSLGDLQDTTAIENIVFTGANGQSWAAVIMFHASHRMINCTFVDNHCTGLGGGVYNLNGSPHFIDCRFMDNTANWGGGYACWETGQPDHPSFLRCTFSGNTATLGGAIGNFRSSPVLTECVFTDNIATERGGAFFNEGTDCCERWFGDVVMDRCVFEGNTAAESGGAVSNRTFGTTLIDGCTISHNVAGILGSAISSTDVTMAILTGSTVCSNLGTSGQIDGPMDLDGTNVIDEDCPVECEGDINGDGTVNITDLLAVIGSWGDPYDVSDLLAVISGWGACE
tara:strand:- start:2860 stop:4002 length:1143 start_codon:yes stop_codon:yes gene_type:complete